MDGPIEFPARRRRDSRRRRKRNGDKPPVIAALDLGTNNCRLLIARPVQGGFKVIDGYSKVVRLGEGLVFTGALSTSAMDRTIAALKICQQKIERRGVVAGRYVATEACRQASNGDQFLERVERETGMKLETISSQEEARLTFDGCVPLLDTAKPFALTFDVGGGSAEIMWVKLDGQSPEVIGWTSLPYGVVTLTERYQASEISADGYRQMVTEIAAELEPFDAAHKIRDRIAAGDVQVLGTAGTVTTISGINMGLTRYNRSIVDGSWIEADVVREISTRLVSSTFKERAALACIGQSRAELVVAGCGVLEAICKTWPADRIRVADRGVREGLLLALAEQVSGGNKQKAPRNEPA